MSFTTWGRRQGDPKNEKNGPKWSPELARRTGRTAASVVIAATASVGLMSSAMAAPDDEADAQVVSTTTSSGGSHTQAESDGHGGHGSGDAGQESSGGHGGHGEGGGDACTFFLDHMWANEDGIPLIGTFSHFNEFHTDDTYENLILSLASGAIGNSDMPVIDIYGGPLGWIPIFNPSHVKGHGTDYVTLLTSCGGIGLPLDTNDLTTLNVPSVEELADLSDLIIPGLPTPEMLTDPNYIWETTDASDILQRLDPETLTNLDDYVTFAGDHVDTWRLLWETALESVSSGNPTEILEVLEITENINTLESLGGVLGGDSSDDSEDGDGGLLSGLPTGDLLGDLPVLGGEPSDDAEGTDDGSGEVNFTVDQAVVEIIAAADTPEGVGEQVRMTVPVTNSGDTTVATLQAQSDLGEVTCEADTLAAGESTTCAVTFTPNEGENAITVTFGDGADSSNVGSFEFVLTYDGTDGTDGSDGSDGSDGTDGTDEPGGNLLDGLPTGDLLDGLPTGDLVGNLPTGDLLGDLPLLGGDGSDGSGEVNFTVDQAVVEIIAAADTPEGVGEQVRMTVPVTNSGDTTVATLQAQSDLGEVTCEADTLAAGESTTCAVTFTPNEGENAITVTFGDGADSSNVGSFEFVLTYDGTDGTDGSDGSDGSDGTDGSDGNNSGSGTVAFTVDQPTVQVIAAGDTADGVGEQVRMTIPVTNNTGSTVTLGAQSESGGVACEADTLAAGESTTCAVTFTPNEGENAITVTFVDEADSSKVTTYRFVCNYASAA